MTVRPLFLLEVSWFQSCVSADVRAHRKRPTVVGSSKRVITKTSCLRGSGARLSTQPPFREYLSQQRAAINFDEEQILALVTRTVALGFKTSHEYINIDRIGGEPTEFE